jgi:hypothetical protein
MPRKTQAARVCGLLILLATLVHSQSTAETPFDRLNRLIANYADLKVDISSDRTTYFPGEPGQITISIFNPTSAALEVPDVRNSGAQGFDLLLKGFMTKPGTDWSTPQYPVGPPPLTVPSTFVQPGQRILLTFRTLDQNVQPWIDTGSMPSSPGPYRLAYRLGGSVDFEVGAPLVEVAAMATLHRTRTYWDDDGNQISEPLAAVVLAAGLGGDHLLLIAGKDMPSTYQVETNPDQTLDAAQVGQPWIRLRSVKSRITSLKATADASDLITIQYTTSDGTTQTVHLDSTRHAIN